MGDKLTGVYYMIICDWYLKKLKMDFMRLMLEFKCILMSSIYQDKDAVKLVFHKIFSFKGKNISPDRQLSSS